MTEAGFFLTEDDQVCFVDAEGSTYYANSHFDLLDAEARGIKFVQCDEGIYYFRAEPVNVSNHTTGPGCHQEETATETMPCDDSQSSSSEEEGSEQSPRI